MFFYPVLVDAPAPIPLGAARGERLGSECGKHFWLSEMFVLMGIPPFDTAHCITCAFGAGHCGKIGLGNLQNWG